MKLGFVANNYRTSSGVPGRLPRIVPRGGAQFGKYHVPEGVSRQYRKAPD